MGTARIQGQLWSAGARDWSTLQEPLHAPLWQAMLGAGQVGPGRRVLDAGCGGGGSSALIAATGAQVMGIDAAPGLIGVAIDGVPGGTFVVGNIESLPSEHASFDTVIAANAVQFTAEPVATLRGFARVCRRAGQAAQRTLGADRLRAVLERAAADFRDDAGAVTIGPNIFHYVAATA